MAKSRIETTHRHLDGDGWRARIGIAVPSVNTVMEPWAQRVVPAGVGLYFSRMFIPPDTTAETLIEMDRTEGKAAIRQLSSVLPHVIAYGCTASSIVQGLNYDAHLRAEIAETHHTASTTAAHAILTALEAVGAKTVSLVSPYTKAVDDAEHHYFETAGLKIAGGGHLGISDGFELASPSPATLYDLGLKGCHEIRRRARHLVPQYPLAHCHRCVGACAGQAGHILDASDALACAAAGGYQGRHSRLWPADEQPLSQPGTLTFRP